MDFREMGIGDKELFDKYIAESNLEASEYNFTNFFMWRKFYRAMIAEHEGLLCVLGNPEYSRPFVFMPMGSIDSERLGRLVKKLGEYFTENDWQLCFSRIEEESLIHFKSLRYDNIIIDFDRDNSDYVYLTEDLANLSGKKFNKKRNHLNAFLKENHFEYHKLDEKYLSECKTIMKMWCEKRDCCCIRGEYCERHANDEVIDNYKELNVNGAVIKINDRYEAFTVGENYHENYAVIHIEKANESIRGLYNVINREFIRNEFGDTEFINREQDLGQMGLRKAKLSYKPIRFINKYNIYL